MLCGVLKMIEDLKIEFYDALIRDVKEDGSDGGWHYLPATKMQGTVNGQTYYASEAYDNDAVRQENLEKALNSFFESIKKKHDDIKIIENLKIVYLENFFISEDGGSEEIHHLIVKGTYNDEIRQAITEIKPTDKIEDYIVKLYNRLVEDFENEKSS